ncbi:MAG: hgd [Paenibacillaceae bacterium]|jgi:3-hydroxyisobutyrate dehydrogenase|nr:hgd [Paenibacillaceae bacterium]
MQIGFIGLGIMGSAMAENLVKAEHRVQVYDVSPQSVEALAQAAAVACSSVAEACRGASVICLSLPNDSIVTSVLTGPDGVLASAVPGSVIIDFSSISPDTVKALAQTAEECGLTYVDAPVSGGRSGAEAGTLTIMAGCTDQVLEVIRPVLEGVGKRIFALGASGCGAAVKIVNNLLLGVSMAAMGEALALGAKYGLTAAVMNEVVSVSSGRSYVWEAKMKPFVMADSYEGGFAVALQRKDLNLALAAAAQAGLSMPMTEAAEQLFAEAQEHGFGKLDISSVVKLAGEKAGIRV